MDLEKDIKKKGKKLITLNVILILISLVALGFIFTRKEFTGLFKPVKEIRTYDELNVARYNETYVKVYFTNVYTTGYVYKSNNEVTGQYLDFDMEGYSLIALVKKDEATKILDGSQNYIEGRLEKFSGDNKNVYDKIVNNYVKKNVSEEYSEAELKSIFLPVQLDNYTYGTAIISILFFIGIIVVVDIICIVYLTKGIRNLKLPFKQYKMDEETIEEIKREYESDNFAYKTKNFCMSENYIFIIFPFRIEVHKIEDIRWAYYRVVKQNFATVFKGTVFRFIDKGTVQVEFQDENLFNKIHEKNDKAVFGFTSQNSRLYSQMVKEYKKEGKDGI